MIYRIKKGQELHNKVLYYISENDKWVMAFALLDDLFDFEITKVGIYPTLNEKKSFKVDLEKVPKEYQKIFDRNGWLLPNNKYYKKWKSLVDKFNLHSIKKDYLKQFVLGIFINPEIFLDNNNFDLLIKADSVSPLNSENSHEQKIFKEQFELTELEEFPL